MAADVAATDVGTAPRPLPPELHASAATVAASPPASPRKPRRDHRRSGRSPSSLTVRRFAHWERPAAFAPRDGCPATAIGAAQWRLLSADPSPARLSDRGRRPAGKMTVLAWHPI